jgi:putative oxidoreductase
MNPTFPLIARILIAPLFLVAGYNKLMAVAGTAGYFAKLGFPMPDVMVWVAIAIEVGGGLLLLIGWKTRWVSWLLIVFVAIATFMAHRFWAVDAAQYTNQLNAFLKNIAVIGGLLMFVAHGPGSASVDKR